MILTNFPRNVNYCYCFYQLRHQLRLAIMTSKRSKWNNSLGELSIIIHWEISVNHCWKCNKSISIFLLISDSTNSADYKEILLVSWRPNKTRWNGYVLPSTLLKLYGICKFIWNGYWVDWVKSCKITFYWHMLTWCFLGICFRDETLRKLVQICLLRRPSSGCAGAVQS